MSVCVCLWSCCGLSFLEKADNGVDNNDHGQYCFQTSGPVAWLKKQDIKKPDDQPLFFEQTGLIAFIQNRCYTVIMLDQLRGMKNFTTLDLAFRYLQGHINGPSREKTAFLKQQEFQVMLCDITNAPTVFQHLVTQVKSILDLLEGPSFVDV